jgi:hypothetical protein
MPHAAAAQPQRSSSATERETTGGPPVDGVFLRIHDPLGRLRGVIASLDVVYESWFS